MHWSESHFFQRFLEIFPAFFGWTLLLMPFALAPIFPVFVAYFILAFNLYWFLKALNMIRHLVRGSLRMRRNIKVDWEARCQKVSENPAKYLKELKNLYKKTRNKLDYYDYEEIENLNGNYTKIKNWEEVYHAVFVTNYQESFEIASPTYQAILDSGYPKERIFIVSCGEERDKEDYVVVSKQLEEKFGDKFGKVLFFMHKDLDGEVKGKGSNLYSAGHKFMKFLAEERPDIEPENILVTTLDADHLVNSQYFSRLTYKYIIDPARENKTYQPVPVLFNNIWDAPALNRITAISSSLWQIIEAMRPYRLRTFAAHAQSLKTLLVTDFWSTQTVVEDGHQFWRTYFAYNGDMQMVPLLVPVYQDCVLADTYVRTFVNQYKQRRRWAWGITDFPYIVKKYIKHPEIPFSEKFLQTFRHFAGHLSWATASFLIAFAWVPLIFNSEFQNTVLAHNVTYYSSLMARLAWIGIFANMWTYFSFLPKRPENYSRYRYVGMVLQWALSPIMAIFLSSLPAFEAQNRLMLGMYLDTFWVTPKYRKSSVSSKDFEGKKS